MSVFYRNQSTDSFTLSYKITLGYYADGIVKKMSLPDVISIEPIDEIIYNRAVT